MEITLYNVWGRVTPDGRMVFGKIDRKNIEKIPFFFKCKIVLTDITERKGPYVD